MISYLCRMKGMINVHYFPRNFSVASHSMLPLQPPPSTMETHLWYILPNEIKSTAVLNGYMELLSPSEKENVFRMRGDQLRKSALLARALVRTTIARYQINHHVDPKSLKFKKNNYGKPEVDWETEHVLHSSLHFNVSHTSSLIACGVTMGSPVGIDVEEKQRRTKNDVLGFAQRYFSFNEIKFLNAISDPDIQRQEFLKLWTLKEAYVKALGRGFSAAPFKSFSIHYRAPSKESCHIDHNNHQDSEIIVESLEDPVNLTNNWQFSLLELAGSHYAAICMEKDKTIEGKEELPVSVTVWKTIPYVKDELQSGTDTVKEITGMLEPLP